LGRVILALTPGRFGLPSSHSKLPGPRHDFGVRHAHGLAAFGAAIDDREAQHHADLRRGEADTGHGLHRVDHVVPDRADVIGDLAHRLGGVRRRLSGHGMKGLTGILGLQRAARLGEIRSKVTIPSR
jgi:hypothetical protein